MSDITDLNLDNTIEAFNERISVLEDRLTGDSSPDALRTRLSMVEERLVRLEAFQQCHHETIESHAGGLDDIVARLDKLESAQPMKVGAIDGFTYIGGDRGKGKSKDGGKEQERR